MNLSDFLVSKPKHFGLSIGRASLRGVEVDANNRIRTAAEVILPEDVFNDGVLVKKDVFISGLKQLLAAGKFSTEYVAVCFSEAHAYSREYNLPKIPLEEIHEAISWRVKDLFPFPVEDIYFDWRLIESEETEHKISIVAVQKKVIDPLVEAIVSTHLKPLGFEPGAASIARLLVLKAGQFAIMTEVNRKGAYVTLFEEKRSLFTTVVNYTAEDTPQTYLKAINQTIIEIIAFYKQKNVLSETSVISIVLSGELTIQPIIDSVKNELPYPVSVLPSPLNNPAYNKAYSVAAFPVYPPQNVYSVNLLPFIIQKEYNSERRSQFYKTLLIRSTLAMCAVLTLSLGTFIAIAAKKQNIELRTKFINEQSKSQTSNIQNLLLLNGQATDVVTLAPQRITPRAKLLILQNILPSSIQVSQWEYDDSSLEYKLTGTAQRRDELLAFKEKLEQTEEFEKVTLPLGSLETPVNVKFTMSFITKN